ncbi:hypothetical protein M918_01085 [Clostridium sp. BL8]|uniref:glycosyltransferase family 4 protein n=1 Tax=Clostridium sp. BL8 TaxID=1354301 RepID=UPI00038A00F8|nr:glycosyltransferase family 1 protein [Clostridium sp. BL8]EQB90269.1 hypothetical protein M918_01085 [Clostridium sp. BL8]
MKNLLKKYFKSKKFEKILCNIESNKVGKRIIWQNAHLNSLCLKNGVETLFTPVYSKPLINDKSLTYITTIHDLQALHYPEYFSKGKYYWLRFAWKRCAKTSDKIIAISEFVKRDIIGKLNIKEDRIKVIYNPIIENGELYEFNKLSNKLNIKSRDYFYTVSQLLPHKNLKTLLYTMKEIKDNEVEMPQKLIISGVGGKDKETLINLIRELDLEENVKLTGFVSNEERDSLYSNSAAFLFPSIFEGFGMPPIEAMKLGVKVITTKCSCIPEVTEGKAYYVNDSYNAKEWVDVIKKALKDEKVIKYSFEKYSLEAVTKEYLNCFREIAGR